MQRCLRMKSHVLYLMPFAVACQASVAPQPVTTTAATMATSIDRAADNIATAQCSRELSCGNIGLEGMEGCTRASRSATRQILTRKCAVGIGRDGLSSCLETIRNDSCGTAESMTERLALACPDSNLCR
jgi:hypothetical protein